MKNSIPKTEVVSVEKIVYPGNALGRGEDGVAVFAEGGLPGEKIEITVTRSKKSFREGFLNYVVEPAPERIKPRCPSFGRCGGCSFQHAAYAHQLAIKEGCVRELMRQLPLTVAPIVPAPREWGYRNKMEFSFFQDDNGLNAGLHRKGAFNRYMGVPPCFIADPVFVDLAAAVISFARASGRPVYDKRCNEGFFRHLVLRAGQRTGQYLVNIVTNRDPGVDAGFFKPLVDAIGDRAAGICWTINGRISDAVNVDEFAVLHGTDTLEEHLDINGRTFRFSVSPFSFFQTNTTGTEKLYEAVISLLEPAAEDEVLDLYCGTGTIGMTVAPRVRRVHGVELVASSIENARANALLNGIDNISFEAGSVEDWVRNSAPGGYSAVVVDPPRAGLTEKVVDFLGLLSPEKIVYVSCNPSTLARDLALLADRHGYRASTVVPVDMFPQTYHVESVTVLRRA